MVTATARKPDVLTDHNPIARKLYGSLGDLRCTDRQTSALPPSSRRLEIPSDERREEKEALSNTKSYIAYIANKTDV